MAGVPQWFNGGLLVICFGEVGEVHIRLCPGLMFFVENLGVYYLLLVHRLFSTW